MNGNAMIIATIATVCIAGFAAGFILMNDGGSDSEVQLFISESKSVSNNFPETVSWSSTDSKVAAVSSEGIITAVGHGKCMVSAVSPEGVEMVRYNVSVKTPSPRDVDVEITREDAAMTVGDSLKLSAIVLPASYDQTIVWVSSNVSVAVVSSDGTVTAVGAGKAEIRAINPLSGEDDDIDIRVYAGKEPIIPPGPKDIEILQDNLYIKVGETKKLSPNQTVSWRSTNTSVATVDDEGNVTAVGIGRCEIIAYTQWDDEDVDVIVL